MAGQNGLGALEGFEGGLVRTASAGLGTKYGRNFQDFDELVFYSVDNFVTSSFGFGHFR